MGASSKESIWDIGDTTNMRMILETKLSVKRSANIGCLKNFLYNLNFINFLDVSAVDDE